MSYELSGVPEPPVEIKAITTVAESRDLGPLGTDPVPTHLLVAASLGIVAVAGINYLSGKVQSRTRKR